MNEVEQLETRVSRLSPEDFARFRTWFRTFDAERAALPDSDASAKLVDESLADYGNGDSESDAPRAETLAGALRRAAAARH
jgi:hypothetical protein